MKKYMLLAICLFFQITYAEQFIYPVAGFQDNDQLMIIYQKNLNDIELWILHTTQNYATKGLSSFLTPANLRILPSQTGFSFIDQGYIKIKEFEKRSPKTVPIYEPIGLFSNMNWIDEHNFYFVARQGDFFQIFQSDQQANLQRLTHDAADALYPQKIDDFLFYIKRDEHNHFTLMRTAWKPGSINESYENSDEEILIKNLENQLCFLKMIDHQTGFFIQAPQKKVKNNQLYEFSCYKIEKNNQIWTEKKLFTFHIPAEYITGFDKLYESIEAFLPNYTRRNYIYYVDWNKEQEQFVIYQFNIIENKKEIVDGTLQRQHTKNKIFAPYMYNNKLYCGQIIHPTDRSFQDSESIAKYITILELK